MKKIMAYLASPYSHPNKEVEKAREIQINKIGALLNELGHCIFPPITISSAFVHFNDQLLGGYEQWRKIDRCAVEHCDELWVCMMDGWQESIGVTDEIYWAKRHNIPVRYLDPITLEFVK